jgi:uncharacterized coiled-coil protein SlyX
MANKILKSLALAAGTGVALGFSASMGRRRNIETPLAQPGDANGIDAIDAIEMRLQKQAMEIATLRAEVDASGRRASAEVVDLERRIANTRAELPAAIEATIAPRVAELRTRLQSEMREAAADGLARIDLATDEKVASRIAALETTLADQSTAIGALNRRAIETDTNLQKLIASVERLCDRAGARPAPEAAAEPSFFELPFETQYKAALERDPVEPPRMFASLK